MRVQAIVKKGDRQWDSIRDNERQALYRVANSMSEDKDLAVNYASADLKLDLTFSDNMSSIIEMMQRLHGMTVIIKNLE